MFSKQQLWILAACILVTTIIFGIFVIHSSGPSLETAVADSSASPSSEAADSDQAAPRTAPKPITLQSSRSIITNGNEADEKIIDAVMAKFATAFKTGDGSVMVERMYTPILEALGGRKKVSEDLKGLMSSLKEVQVVNSWKVKKPFLYVAGKAHKYVVIPYEIKIKFSGKIVAQSGYELGIKTAEVGWQFAGGDMLSEELYDKFFPDFPKDVNLPEVEQSSEN